MEKDIIIAAVDYETEEDLFYQATGDENPEEYEEFIP